MSTVDFSIFGQYSTKLATVHTTIEKSRPKDVPFSACALLLHGSFPFIAKLDKLHAFLTRYLLLLLLTCQFDEFFYHLFDSAKMSGLRDQLTLDLDSTFKSLQETTQSTSELFINLPEPLAGIISPEVASR